jgi:hypothetical protein
MVDVPFGNFGNWRAHDCGNEGSTEVVEDGRVYPVDVNLVMGMLGCISSHRSARVIDRNKAQLHTHSSSVNNLEIEGHFSDYLQPKCH